MHFEKGDTVLLKNDYKSKRFLPYDPRPYQVMEKKGSMVIARRDSTSVARNSSFFKPLVKADNEEFECPDPGIAVGSQENPQENPNVSESDEQGMPNDETSCTETATPRYPRRLRRKPDRYQS